MSQWCVSRSSSAVVIFVSPNTLAHSANVKLAVIMTLVCRLQILTQRPRQKLFRVKAIGTHAECDKIGAIVVD
jgi:hypothetical protein